MSRAAHLCQPSKTLGEATLEAAWMISIAVLVRAALAPRWPSVHQDASELIIARLHCSTESLLHND